MHVVVLNRLPAKGQAVNRLKRENAETLLSPGESNSPRPSPQNNNTAQPARSQRSHERASQNSLEGQGITAHEGATQNSHEGQCNNSPQGSNTTQPRRRMQYSHKGELQHSPRRSNPTQPTQEHNKGGYTPGYLQANRPANKNY